MPKTSLQVNLSQKVALVTGGSGSIGEAIVNALCSNGAQVVIAGRSQTYVPKNPKSLYISTDVSSEEHVQALVEKIIETYKKIDVAVFAHGVQLRKKAHMFTRAEWETIINTNLTGTFLLTKHIVPFMIQQKSGSLIGITSLTATYGITHISAYAASKGGMAQFLKSVAVELAPENVRVNMIAPGRIKTRMTDDVMRQSALYKAQLSRIPMGRIGTPDDVGEAVLFLCSEAASYITGETLIIDGGWVSSIGNPPA